MVQLTHRPLRTHLTGRARTRKSFWGNQILEVEVRTDYYQGWDFIYSRMHWRDASQNDLNECILRFWNPVDGAHKPLPVPEKYIGPNPPPKHNPIPQPSP